KGSKEQQQGQGEGSKGAQASKDQQQGQGAQASKAPEQKQGSVAGEPAKDQRPEPQPGAAQGAPKTGEAPQQLAQAGRAGAGEEGMTPDDASRLLRALERSERGFGRWNSNAGQPSRVAEPEKDW
ncbi:MAG: hypothetical protein KC933_39230, partial [Myxococcales bacterium]|nr:hypothetical protein [Myxococcales bacterium]